MDGVHSARDFQDNAQVTHVKNINLMKTNGNIEPEISENV